MHVNLNRMCVCRVRERSKESEKEGMESEKEHVECESIRREGMEREHGKRE